jgi:hypothetical protein
MVEPVRPKVEKEIQSDLARLEMIEALRQGNIYEVMKKLPAGLSIRDFEDYMSQQWRNFKSQIVQDYKIYEGEAAVPEPAMGDFAVHDESSSWTPEEGHEFLKGMMASLGKAAEGEGAEMPAGTDIGSIAEGTLDEWESFMNDMWGQIFDAQMVADYQKKMGEIQKEVQHIIAMAKSGQVDPEYVLIALAKVNVTKNGCLMTWLGKKAFMTNETMNRVANDLRMTPSSDPAYYSKLQDAQAKTRDGSFQLQMLVADMQKVMQDVAGVLEQVHSFMGEINRTRREIITKVAAH